MSKQNENKSMGNFIAENWAVLLGGGTITSAFGWFFYGRKNNNAEFTTKVQAIYAQMVDDLKADRDMLKEELVLSKKKHDEDVLYFRKQIDGLNKKSDDLQKQFNDINISYSKEVEISQNWEKLHSELKIKYDDMQTKYKLLLTDHNKLKKSFETYKKSKEVIKN